MKKNFLKKLAFTMAFATVFTTLAPAAGVFAAKAPSLNVGKKLTLLLGTEREEFDINVNNKVSGSKYAWSTSNKAVATVNSKGIVEGQKVGSAKVTLKITLPTKKTATLTTTVDVKDNIKEVAIANAPKEAIKVGDEYDFNRTIVETFGGNTKAHKGAVTRWEIVSENKDKATIDESGVFVATEVGVYEVVAKSFQSKAKYASYLKTGNEELVTAESDSVKVTVSPSIVSITQKTATKFEVAFDAKLSDEVNKDNLVITNAAGVKLPIIKAVKFDDAGKVATVETFINLTDKETYTVSYKELTKEFVASVGVVEKVVITGPLLVADNEAKKIEYKLYDANGVEVSKGANATIEFVRVNNTGWIDGDQITLFSIGDKAVIKAVYKTGVYDSNWNEVVIESNEYVVTAVDSVDAITSGITAWTISDYKASKSDADYSKVTHEIPLKTSGKYLYVKGLDSANEATYNFKFTSTDTNKLIVDETTGALITVATGTVGVIVKSGNFQTVINVVITPEAKAATVEPNMTSSILSNVAAVNDSATFKLTIKDQYGNKVTATGLDVTALAAPSAIDSNADNAKNIAKTYVSYDVVNGVAEFTFNASEKAAGTYTYKLTASEKSVVVTVVVRAKEGEATSWRIVTDSNSYDLAVNKDTVITDKKVTVNAYAYDKNGTKIALIDDAALTLKHSDGTVYNLVDAGTGAWTVTTVTGSALVTKALKTGNYTVTGTTVVGDATKTLVPAYFEVKDTQVAPKVTQEKAELTITKNDDFFAKLKEAFKVESNNNATIAYSITGSGIATTANVVDSKVQATGTYDVLVKKLVVTEAFSNGLIVERDVEVNRVIKVKVTD